MLVFKKDYYIRTREINKSSIKLFLLFLFQSIRVKLYNFKIDDLHYNLQITLEKRCKLFTNCVIKI